jgi:hypothetical protein
MADYDKTADREDEEDDYLRGKMVLGELTDHTFQRLAKKRV